MYMARRYQAGRCDIAATPGSDGIGHRTLAQLSCLAVARRHHEHLRYVHMPPKASVNQHNTSVASAERWFGLQHASPAVFNARAQQAVHRSFAAHRAPGAASGFLRSAAAGEGKALRSSCKHGVVYHDDNCWKWISWELWPPVHAQLRRAYYASPKPPLRKTSLAPPPFLNVDVHVRLGDIFTNLPTGVHRLAADMGYVVACVEALAALAAAAGSREGGGRPSALPSAQLKQQQQSEPPPPVASARPLSIVLHTDGNADEAASIAEQLQRAAGPGAAHVRRGPDDALTALHHMVETDVLIGGFSAFSLLAALYRESTRASLVPGCFAGEAGLSATPSGHMPGWFLMPCTNSSADISAAIAGLNV